MSESRASLILPSAFCTSNDARWEGSARMLRVDCEMGMRMSRSEDGSRGWGTWYWCEGRGARGRLGQCAASRWGCCGRVGSKWRRERGDPPPSWRTASL